MIFRQLFEKESSTYSYLLGDEATGDAILIDPVVEMADRDLQLCNELNLKLRLALNTHCHADHVTGTGALKARLPALRSVIAAAAGAQADVLVGHGEVLRVGSIELEVRATPGHTAGCVTYVCAAAKCAFTGDALLTRGCGRTDFQGGSAETLYDSVWTQILSLPDDFTIYPAHDYKGHSSSSVREEKAHNPRLKKTKPEFVALMGALNLPYPKKIDESLPKNLVCGAYAGHHVLAPSLGLFAPAPGGGGGGGEQRVVLLDVRKPEELVGEFGRVDPAALPPGTEVVYVKHDELIAGAKELEVPKDVRLVVMCQSGARSRLAALYLWEKGFLGLCEIEGGMKNWRAAGLPFTKAPPS